MLLRVHWSSVLSAVALVAVSFVGGDRKTSTKSCIPVYCVTVNPKGGWDPTRSVGGSGYTVDFTVSNTGATGLYVFACRTTGGVTCTALSVDADGDEETILAGHNLTVTATYSVGSSGGTIVLDASHPSVAHDTGWKNVDTPPNLSLVTPVVASGDSAAVHSRTPLILATYSSNDAALDTTSLVVVFGSDTVTSLTRHNSRLVEWEVDASRALTPGTAKNLTIKVCNIAAVCNTHTWHILADNSGAPLVSFSGMPLEAQGRHFSAPFGPGISVSGGEVETGFSVPSYQSMNSEHSTGFVYSTRQAYPRALVNTDIELTWPSGSPDSIRATLFDGSTVMDADTIKTPSCTGGTGRQCRITFQGDFSGTTWTGAVRKWLKVEIKEWSAGTLKTATDSAEVVLVDRRGSPYGRGWYASGQLMFYAAGSDMILVAPDGAATIYRGSGSRWISAPGDHSVLTTDGSGYTLSYRDGTSLVFDSSGRLASGSDAHSNTAHMYYRAGTVESESLMTDPVGHRYQVTYSGSTITVLDSMPGNASRRSVLTLNASNQLAYDSIASPIARPARTTFTYDTVGSNHGNVLTRRIDATNDTTLISYDARKRPTQVTLPRVLAETGSSLQTPVITYRAAEQRGLGALISIDSGYVYIADPLGNWTCSRLNRWGEAITTWDQIGTLSRAAYTAEGFPAWQEGKVSDSTRVYSTYDTLGRLIRRYRYRAAGNLEQLDTLLYDANNNVIRHKNALGLRDSALYVGHDLRSTWKPTGERTYYTYLSNGQTDTVREPMLGRTQYFYDATFKNTGSVIQAGAYIQRLYYDGFGRVNESQRQLSVRRSHDTTFMQWRRRRTWYNDLNQIDSLRVEHTADCVSPCSSPTWPSGSDTTKWYQVKYLYDSLGRDTARVTATGRRTRYVFDVLGRLRMRYPYAESTAVLDSFRYDLAGNTRFQWTRRGTKISHYLDSRNRDTLTNVPGLGDFKHAYGGPNDELTAATIANFVDSIGAVNPDVHWGFSQAGLLLADTAQGSRATSHKYDGYQRDTAITDVNGTWSMRYDASRGILDTAISPFGDNLRWVPDSLWRLIGPYISNGTPAGFSFVPGYDTTQKMTSFTTTQGGVTLGQMVEDNSDPLINLAPYWQEKHGSGGTQVQYTDSLTHDGWERVGSVNYMTNGNFVSSETFNFDNEGNIKPIWETRTYDVATNRLLSYGSGRFIAYDRSGNAVTDSVSGAVWKFTYDPLDRLIAARYNGTLIARYAYDALGRRIVRRVSNAGPKGGTVAYTRMVYAGDQVSAEADSSGTLTLGYTWSTGTDNLVAIHKYGTGSGDWYTVEDPIRSVRGLSKRDSTWAVSYRYKVYGAALDSAGTAPFDLHYRWTGREFDAETGLYFFRSRMYDPTDERFIQEDATGYEGGANLYAYGDGDPTTGRDPSGLRQNDEMTAGRPDGAIPSCIANSDRDCGNDWGGGGWDELDVLSHGGKYSSFNSYQEARTDANIAAYYAAQDRARAARTEAAREGGANQGGDAEEQYNASDISKEESGKSGDNAEAPNSITIDFVADPNSPFIGDDNSPAGCRNLVDVPVGYQSGGVTFNTFSAVAFMYADRLSYSNGVVQGQGHYMGVATISGGVFGDGIATYFIHGSTDCRTGEGHYVGTRRLPEYTRRN